MRTTGDRIRPGRRATTKVVWVLTLVLTLTLAMAASPAAVRAGGKLSPEAAKAMVDQGKITLIDVRSPGEWRQTGIPSGSHAVTIHNPNGIKAFVGRVLETVGGDRSRPVALICAAGVRSARALRILNANGFTDVYDVSAGMSGNARQSGWIARDLPTRSCTGRDAC